MTIDWGSVVGEALHEGSVMGPDSVCSHSTSGNKPTSVGTNDTPQAIDIAQHIEVCSHFPTVPTVFEERQLDARNRAPETPDGGGV